MLSTVIKESAWVNSAILYTNKLSKCNFYDFSSIPTYYLDIEEHWREYWALRYSILNKWKICGEHILNITTGETIKRQCFRYTTIETMFQTLEGFD